MNLFDLIALLVLLGSAWAGFGHGLLRELIGMFAFLLAAVETLHLAPLLRPLALAVVHPAWLGGAASVVVTFVALYVALGFAGRALSERYRTGAAGAIDRTLGLGVGAVRGAAILGVLYLLFSRLPGPGRQGFEAAALFPLAQASGEVLARFAPKSFATSAGIGQALGEAVRRELSGQTLVQTDAQPSAALDGSSEDGVSARPQSPPFSAPPATPSDVRLEPRPP